MDILLSAVGSNQDECEANGCCWDPQYVNRSYSVHVILALSSAKCSSMALNRFHWTGIIIVEFSV